MAPRKTAKGSKFADDAPWRAYKGEKPVPRISKGGIVPVRQGSNFQYAISIMKVWISQLPEWLRLCTSLRETFRSCYNFLLFLM